ncbi:hypothetical protein Agub_g1099 [Astrephomene gubernaculifera]|uniref:Uncharacterized protein n=1 Tax=Astrephomene gubernaculifera TaxID=47775 RepID=A0AAD3DET9_9CHLO|nr:hypothetical protein Agub_g1099 [Astrephomene gubernaculifera]
MAREAYERSPSGSWDADEDDSDSDFPVGGIFPDNGLISTALLANSLRAHDLRASLEALAKLTNDPAMDFASPDLLPPGWDAAKEFVGYVLQNAFDKFYRVDAFLRAHQDYPEQLFACMYYLCYACSGLTSIVAESSHIFGDAHDHELQMLLANTFNILDIRAGIYTLLCTRQLPDLEQLIERTRTHLQPRAQWQVSSGESDDDVGSADDAEQEGVGVIHLGSADRHQPWRAFLVQLLQALGFLDSAAKIMQSPRPHSLQLYCSLLQTVFLVLRLLRTVARQPPPEQRLAQLEQGFSSLLRWLCEEVLADPERLFAPGRGGGAGAGAGLAVAGTPAAELHGAGGGDGVLQ